MTRRLKPVEIGLAADLQEAILSLPLEIGGTLMTIGTLVRQAEESLQIANRAVRENALIQMTADSLMRQEKRRGIPEILVNLDGTVCLRISYAAEEPPPSTPEKGLPSLGELRVRADLLGIDISDLGRQKRKIIERLRTFQTEGEDDLIR